MKARLLLALLVGSFSLGVHAKPIDGDWMVGSNPWSKTGMEMARIQQEALDQNFSAMSNVANAALSSQAGNWACTGAISAMGTAAVSQYVPNPAFSIPAGGAFGQVVGGWVCPAYQP